MGKNTGSKFRVRIENKIGAIGLGIAKTLG
jgi:hypothetical protein